MRCQLTQVGKLRFIASDGRAASCFGSDIEGNKLSTNSKVCLFPAVQFVCSVRGRVSKCAPSQSALLSCFVQLGQTFYMTRAHSEVRVDLVPHSSIATLLYASCALDSNDPFQTFGTPLLH